MNLGRRELLLSTALLIGVGAAAWARTIAGHAGLRLAAQRSTACRRHQLHSQQLGLRGANRHARRGSQDARRVRVAQRLIRPEFDSLRRPGTMFRFL